MAKLSGYSEREVTRQTVATALKIAAGRTKVADSNQLPFRARLRAEKRAFGHTNISKNPYGISINTGRRGGHPGEVWYRHPASKKFQQMGVVSDGGEFVAAHIHWKSTVWGQAKAGISAYRVELRKAFPDIQSSVGLARQSWVQIADSLGIRLEDVPGRGASPEAIAKARGAMASNGRAYINGRGAEAIFDNRYRVVLINSLPYADAIRFQAMMSTILSGEADRFLKAHEKGVFVSISKMKRVYPWVKIVGAPPSVPS